MRVPETTTACWFDGNRLPMEQVRLGIDDPTVLAGMGLFETLAVHDGRLMELELHLARLRSGAHRLRLSCPETAGLRDVLLAATAELALDRGWLKLILTGLGSTVVFGGPLEGPQERPGASAVLLPWRRNLQDPLAGLKTLNYAPNLLGMASAREQGADEGIWLNTRGHLAEGCATNLFVVQGRKLFTPREGEGILPGILRSIVLRASRGLGISTHEGKLRLRRLQQAREAFLTSSLQGVRPLVRFQGRSVGPGRPGPITLRIAAEVRRMRGLAESGKGGVG